MPRIKQVHTLLIWWHHIILPNRWQTGAYIASYLKLVRSVNMFFDWNTWYLHATLSICLLAYLALQMRIIPKKICMGCFSLLSEYAFVVPKVWGLLQQDSQDFLIKQPSFAWIDWDQNCDSWDMARKNSFPFRPGCVV